MSDGRVGRVVVNQKIPAYKKRINHHTEPLAKSSEPSRYSSQHPQKTVSVSDGGVFGALLHSL